jgi:hypothetical protein
MWARNFASHFKEQILKSNSRVKEHEMAGNKREGGEKSSVNVIFWVEYLKRPLGRPRSR